MPQLGESVTEGTITTWLVKEGDYVNKYDPIAEIMTDKVNAEVPSSYAGTIKEIITKEGETIAVGEVMCTMTTDADQEDTAEQTSSKQLEVEEAKVDDAHQSMKKRYSPAVLKMAHEHNIDLNQVSGTGRGGRITRKDIEAIITSGDVPTPLSKTAPDVPPPVASASPQQEVALPTSGVGDIEIPVTGVRKMISQNMVRSKQEIPHAWMTVEVDVTDLVTYRQSIKDQFKQQEGFNL